MAEENKSEAAGEENKEGAAEYFSSELEEPRWSVVSFEKLAAKNLTYVEAEEKLKQLEAEKIAGLCIITDEAAKRISKQN
ncbi:MAG: hypothetical protein M3033_09080 [Acidobacteriota bacterium]|nr:hypothetical protein [Acidobacteriota bacterium]